MKKMMKKMKTPFAGEPFGLVDETVVVVAAAAAVATQAGATMATTAGATSAGWSKEATAGLAAAAGAEGEEWTAGGGSGTPFPLLLLLLDSTLFLDSNPLLGVGRAADIGQ
jgi:hypothetical protein